MQSRRHLLRTAALSTAAIALAPHVRAQDPKKLGYALVGIGSLSKNQLVPALAKCQHSKLVALVTGHPQEKAPPIVQKYNLNPKAVYTYENYDQIKDNPDIDVVYIVLPNSMHAEYTIRAFQAGKHVLCEKPMANTVDECKQMIDAAKAANKKFQIGYRLHYEPLNLKAVELCRAPDFGRIKHIEAAAGFPIGDPKQWRLNRQLAGGGSLMDIGIYALNATRYLAGEEPVEVTAMNYSTPDDPRFKEVEETTLFDLRFKSGLLASCTSSYGFGINRFRVTGDKGAVVEAEPFLSYGGNRLFHKAPRKEREEVKISPVDHFAAEMDAFSQAILENKPIKATGEEGLQDMKIITALYEAARSGKAVKVG